jgi:anti-sigma factor RsiW
MEVNSHLESCLGCRQEVAALREQSRLVQELRVDAEPMPGFYARVLQRIEETAARSIWAVFVYTPFGKRLAYASLALALVFGGYVVGMEAQDGHMTATLADGPVLETPADTSVHGDEGARRDAVLVNFVNSDSGN